MKIVIFSVRGDGRYLRLDEFLGSKDPRNSPSWQTESLSKAVNDENVILIDILDVVSGGDDRAVTITSIVVTRVELITDERCTSTADVLDLSKLRVGDDATSRVAGV